MYNLDHNYTWRSLENTCNSTNNMRQNFLITSSAEQRLVLIHCSLHRFERLCSEWRDTGVHRSSLDGKPIRYHVAYIRDNAVALATTTLWWSREIGRLGSTTWLKRSSFPSRGPVTILKKNVTQNLAYLSVGEHFWRKNDAYFFFQSSSSILLPERNCQSRS